MRHDEPKNLFAKLAAEAFRDVETEPLLQPLTGEVLKRKTANRKDDARSDVRIRGFWRKQQSAYFEFRVFYPFAQTYKSTEPAKLYDKIARVRELQYKERINIVDNGSFTPMIMSSTGGMGDEMDNAVKHLAQTLAETRKQEYSLMAGILRARFAFATARSALVCLRGSRNRCTHGQIHSLRDNSSIIACEARIGC